MFTTKRGNHFTPFYYLRCKEMITDEEIEKLRIAKKNKATKLPCLLKTNETVNQNPPTQVPTHEEIREEIDRVNKLIIQSGLG